MSATRMQIPVGAKDRKSAPLLNGYLLFFCVVICFNVWGQRSATGYSIKSKAFLDEKKFKEALQYADSAIAFARALDNADTLAQSYRWRFGVRTAMQDYKNALEDYMFSEEYASRAKSGDAEKKDKQLNGLLLLEQEAHRKDNILFNARINELQRSTESERRNLFMAAGSLLLLTTLAIFFYFRKRGELKNFADQASEEVKELRLSRDNTLTALSGRLAELRLMVEDLGQSFALTGAKASIDRQSAIDSTIAVRKNIDELMKWLTASQGISTFQPVKFDCKELTEATLAKFERQIAEKKIKSEVFMSEGQWVFADKQMIASVMENLISNAIKFTPAGGSMSCFAGISQDIVSIGVKDSGPGMTQQSLVKLFDQKEFSTEHQGLGLMLCKELVERNGGRIYAESEVGKGSTFYFTLPGTAGVR